MKAFVFDVTETWKLTNQNDNGHKNDEDHDEDDDNGHVDDCHWENDEDWVFHLPEYSRAK